MRCLLPLIFIAAATPALAATETLIRFDDPAVHFASALGKQVNVRFSDSFARDRLDRTDFDAVVVSELPEGKVCLFGRDQGLDPENAKLADVGRLEQGDICVARSDVSARATGQDISGQPAMPIYNTVKDMCVWSWKTGKGIGLWSEDCQFESGRWTVIYDEAQDHYALRVDDGEPFPVLRQFRVEAGQGPDGLLPSLKAKGLVLDSPDCRFEPSAEQFAPAGWTIWNVMPTGKVKEAFDALPKDEVPEPPCGELGYAVDFTGFFMVHKDYPDRVIYVNLGQDGTMIDPFSLSLF